ncbi:MAG: VWA domain-containing protein [Acidobacteriota bacterium]|nr:VWA domain-containing protein [Acidobacteriota bacterium]
MRRRSAALLVWGGIVLAAVQPTAAEVSVRFESPKSTDYAIGTTPLVVTIDGDEPVERVEFYVDGRRVGTATEPPYAVIVDVGQAMKGHEFEAVAHTRSGDQARATVATDVVRVDEQMELSLQQLYVTATRGDTRVTDLHREDFRVRDQGSVQRIVTFEQGDVPLTAVLLLDCSESMHGGRLEEALAGAGVFLERMSELDEAAVVLFSDRLLRATEFSQDRRLLLASLAAVTPTGGTALNDHLFMGLQRLEPRQGRRVVVLFSDGKDVHSALPMAEVLAKTRTSPALLYWIYLTGDVADRGPNFYSSWRRSEDNGEEFLLLQRAIRESGGRIEVVTDPAQLDEAFADILAELREQYVLGYYPTNRRRDGKWHKVDVAVPGDSAKARTRAGYFDRRGR